MDEPGTCIDGSPYRFRALSLGGLILCGGFDGLRYSVAFMGCPGVREGVREIVGRYRIFDKDHRHVRIPFAVGVIAVHTRGRVYFQADGVRVGWTSPQDLAEILDYPWVPELGYGG